jgi:tetratricopeptide (TPR) repeat protein
MNFRVFNFAFGGIILVGLCSSEIRGSQDPPAQSPAFAKGERLMAIGKFDAALAAFNQALQSNPKDYVSLCARSGLYARRGEYDRAVADASEALTQAPQLQPAYSNRGFAYYRKGLLDQAMADYEKALKLVPNDAVAMISRGWCLIHLGKFQESIKDFDRGIASFPGWIWGTCGRGFALLKMGERERARADAERMVELDPRLALHFGGETALDVFDIDLRRRHVAERMAESRKAEEAGDLLSAFQALQDARTWMHGFDAEDERNVNVIEKSIRRIYPRLAAKPALPEEARRYQVQAETLVKNKNYKSALTAYRKLLTITPWWPKAYFNCAVLEAELQHYFEAIEEMKDYLALSPDAPDARASKDKIYEWEVQIGSQ